MRRTYAQARSLAIAASIALTLSAARALAQEADVKVPGRNAALRAAFKDVAEKSGPCAVRLAAKGGAERGYGVLLDGGIVVTAATNVKSDDALQARGRDFRGTAKVLQVDKGLNVAVLKLVEVPKGAAALGSSAGLEIGQFVVAIGGGAEPLAAGVLSAKDRAVEPRDLSGNVLFGLFSDGNDGPKRAYAKVLQHDAPIVAETVGSPLVDAQGKLVGMNVDTAYRGSAYAIGVDELVAAVERAKRGEPPPAAPAPRTREKAEKPAKPAPSKAEGPEKKTDRPAAGKPRLGVAGRDPTDAERERLGLASGGVMVAELQPDGPGVRAGLHPGDVILAIDGVDVASLDDLASKLVGKSPGDEVKLSIRRGKKTLTLPLTLGGQG